MNKTSLVVLASFLVSGCFIDTQAVTFEEPVEIDAGRYMVWEFDSEANDYSPSNRYGWITIERLGPGQYHFNSPDRDGNLQLTRPSGAPSNYAVASITDGPQTYSAPVIAIDGNYVCLMSADTLYDRDYFAPEDKGTWPNAGDDTFHLYFPAYFFRHFANEATSHADYNFRYCMAPAPEVTSFDFTLYNDCDVDIEVGHMYRKLSDPTDMRARGWDGIPAHGAKRIHLPDSDGTGYWWAVRHGSHQLRFSIPEGQSWLDYRNIVYAPKSGFAYASKREMPIISSLAGDDNSNFYKWDHPLPNETHLQCPAGF